MALRQQIGQPPVVCTVRGTDRYDRALGICQDATGTDLNGWLVAYRRYSTTSVPKEDQAKTAKSGIWADEFVPPWNWRCGDRLD
ncbi:MAG: hypothetical protein J4F42_16580 [Desulfurellaceae bacterium]|nr:hypothetical protein [Desulfurellaceae bacterium]